MNFFFRVDSSNTIGAGHLMRCLVLAEGLKNKGAKITFICRDLPGNLNDVLGQIPDDIIVLPSKTQDVGKCEKYSSLSLEESQEWDAELTINVIKDTKPNWIVVDHYSLSIFWEKLVKPHVEKLMVIDDFPCRKHECDLLLDQNAPTNFIEKYKVLTPVGAKLLLGRDYVLLNKEFLIIRNQYIGVRNRINRALVFFTLGDDQGQTLKALRGIEEYGGVSHVDVVVGKANIFAYQIEQMCLRLGWSYHCQIDFMPLLMSNADLAIGAAGSSSWERCSLGLPSIVVILAENQSIIADSLASAGAVMNLGWHSNITEKNYKAALSKLAITGMDKMSKAAMEVFDANGTSRVINELIGEGCSKDWINYEC